MTSKRTQYDWSLLGIGSEDPVPADEFDVLDVSNDFRDRGNVMSAAATMLKNASESDAWIGEASNKFVDKAEEAHGDLSKASEKYTDAAQALRTFSSAVSTARDRTLAAVKKAEAAEQQRAANATSGLDGVDDPTDAQKDADERRETRLTEANSAANGARSDFNEAMSALDSAAKTCASAIRDASEQYKDGRMDDIKGAVRSVLKVLVDALNVIALVVAVVIIALLILGTGGAILAILIPLAFALGAVIFALTAVQYAMGDADGLDLGLAFLGMAGGGLGKVFGKATSATLKGIRTTYFARQIATAKSGLRPGIQYALRITSRNNGLKKWALREQTAAIRAAVDPAVSAFNDAKVTNRILKGLELDDVVGAHRQINVMKTLDLSPAELAQMSTAQWQNLLAGSGVVMNTGSQFYQAPDTIRTAFDFPQSFGDMTNQVPEGLDSLKTQISQAGR